MSGERPDFQQPTGITSQAGGVASAEEFAAQSDDIGVNTDTRFVSGSSGTAFLLDPNVSSGAVVIQRVFFQAATPSPSEIELQVTTTRTTFTGSDAELFTDASQTPVTVGPGYFLNAGQQYLIDINNNTSSSVVTKLAVVLRRVQ
jgi:hypothetical protein